MTSPYLRGYLLHSASKLSYVDTPYYSLHHGAQARAAALQRLVQANVINQVLFVSSAPTISGDIFDNGSGKDNHAKLVESPAIDAGAADYIVLPSLGYTPDDTFAFSMSFSTTDTTTGYLISTQTGSNGAISVHVMSNGTLGLKSALGYVGYTTGVYNDGVVHELFMYYSGNNMVLFVDGVEEVNTPKPASTWVTSAEFVILGRNNNIGGYTSGVVGLAFNIRVWEGANTPTNPTVATEVGLVRWYPCSSTKGTTVFNVAQDSLHGKLIANTTNIPAMRSGKQDTIHYNITKGFDHAAWFNRSAYVDLPSHDIVGDFDIEVSFSTNPAFPEMVLLSDSFATDNYIYLHNYNTLRWYHKGVQVAEGDASGVYDGSLHTIVCRRVGTVSTLYIDGNLVGSGTISGDNYTWEPRIGNDRYFTNVRFVGYIYTVTITHQERGHKWDLSNGSGSSVIDSVGGLTGTIVGDINDFWGTQIPANMDGTGLARIFPSNPAGICHNGADTKIDFTNGGTNVGNFPALWSYGDVLANPFFYNIGGGNAKDFITCSTTIVDAKQLADIAKFLS